MKNEQPTRKRKINDKLTRKTIKYFGGKRGNTYTNNIRGFGTRNVTAMNDKQMKIVKEMYKFGARRLGLRETKKDGYGKMNIKGQH